MCCNLGTRCRPYQEKKVQERTSCRAVANAPWARLEKANVCGQCDSQDVLDGHSCGTVRAAMSCLDSASDRLGAHHNSPPARRAWASAIRP